MIAVPTAYRGTQEHVAVLSAKRPLSGAHRKVVWQMDALMKALSTGFSIAIG
jgi:hypothetical protein